MKVAIRNFQIIEKADIHFKPGLNLITGPSNNGKSAIFRAIEASLFNKPGSSFVTKGQSQCAVAIRFDGEPLIVWKKINNQASYEVDKKLYTKLGRAGLKEVEDISRVKEVNVLDKAVRMNFWRQMEYPFLLDETPSRLFNFLSRSSQKEDLNVIQKRMVEDVKEIRKSVTVTEAELNIIRKTKTDLTSKLDIYKNVDTITEGTISMGPKIETIKDLEDIVVNVIDVTNNLDKANQQLTSRAAIVNFMDTSLKETGLLSSTVSGLSQIITTLGQVERALTGTEEKLKINNDNLNNISTNYTQIKENITYYSREEEKKDKLNNIIKEVERVFKVVKDTDLSIDKVNKTLTAVNTMQVEQKHINSQLELTQLVSNLDNSSTQCKEIDESLENKQVELKQVIEELSKIKVCPLCSGERG